MFERDKSNPFTLKTVTNTGKLVLKLVSERRYIINKSIIKFDCIN